MAHNDTKQSTGECAKTVQTCILIGFLAKWIYFKETNTHSKKITLEWTYCFPLHWLLLLKVKNLFHPDSNSFLNKGTHFLKFLNTFLSANFSVFVRWRRNFSNVPSHKKVIQLIHFLIPVHFLPNAVHLTRFIGVFTCVRR